jgi:hypothetical protein
MEAMGQGFYILLATLPTCFRMPQKKATNLGQVNSLTKNSAREGLSELSVANILRR